MQESTGGSIPLSTLPFVLVNWVHRRFRDIWTLRMGLCSRAGRLFMVSPHSQAPACPLSGGNSTYRPVQNFGTTSLFGNGLSSSPSNTPLPFDRAGFPNVTLYDNVVCQHRLVTQNLEIDRLRLVLGFSMGAQQAFHWG